MLVKYDRIVYKGVLFKRYRQPGYNYRCYSCDGCLWHKTKENVCYKPKEYDSVFCLDLDNSEYYYRPCYVD